MQLTFSIITIILALLTVLPISKSEVWWVRGLDFPRLQLFLVILTVLFLELALLDLSQPFTLLLVFSMLVCLFYQAWWILPYTIFFPVEVKSTRSFSHKNSIKILTANVLMHNRNAASFIALVQEYEPDILVALESDSWWQTHLDRLADNYPYSIKCPLENLYGMHVYSKFPLMNCQTEYLVEPDVPSMHALIRLPSGHSVRIHFLHPAPPSPTENEESAERDAELIIVAKSVADVDLPVIVTGDLNDVAWSHTTRLFRKISGLLDPRVGRGMFNTFHADYKFMRWPLDHLFHSSHFTLKRLERLRSFGSDHFALFTELVFELDRNDTSSGLDAEKDEKIEARMKVMNQSVDKHDVPQPEKHSF